MSVKSRCACEWGGSGRLSVDEPGHYNPERCEGPWGKAGVATAWRLETDVIVVFVAISLLGARLPLALIIGYSLHGLWDLLHELQVHGAYSVFEPGQLTAIPLGHGVFCAVFDFCMAGYFYPESRRPTISAILGPSR